eukprot:EG_transcript_7434
MAGLHLGGHPHWGLSLLVLLWSTSVLVVGRVAEDEVAALPGWKGPLPSRVYAGYVPAGESFGHVLHEQYYFVESEGDPAADPVVVWTNGGPGASSFFGPFVEFGPLMLSAASRRTPEYNRTGIPTLWRNEYSWTQFANLLLINSPPPVSYSYCDPAGPSGDGYSCGPWNDTRTAYHNAVYLENWLQKFPEFGRNAWYIVGESYAGIYVPTLVRQILSNPQSKVARLLRGFAVGDGCVGTHVLCGDRAAGPYFLLQFLHGHGQYSDPLHRQVMAQCPRDQLLGYGVPVTDPNCSALLRRVGAEVGPYYEYGLYDACWYQNSLDPPKLLELSKRRWWGPPPPPPHGKSLLREGVNDYDCGGPQAMYEWIQRPEVKRALHVPHDAVFFSGDNGVNFPYTMTEPDLLPFYQHIARETPLRVLVYNGDTDPELNSFIAQNWTRALGLPEREGWRPWTIDGRSYAGGSVTRYRGDLDFATVRGAGHMVPLHKPRVTFELLSRWLRGEDWLPYKPDL